MKESFVTNKIMFEYVKIKQHYCKYCHFFDLEANKCTLKRINTDCIKNNKRNIGGNKK